MFVTIDRAAIESAIRAEYARELTRDCWYTAVSRYGVLAVSESWDDCQDATMEYVNCAVDEDEEECLLAECAIRHATDSETVDALIKRELNYIAMSTRCLLADSIDELRQAVIDELLELGYQDSFIRFDSCAHYCHYYDGDMMFEVTPQF